MSYFKNSTMKKAIALFVCLVVVTSAFYIDDKTLEKESIVAGYHDKISEVPYTVLLRLENRAQGIRAKCTGIIIGKTWILTAAHCIRRGYSIKVGTGGSGKNMEVQEPIRTIKYEKYRQDYPTEKYDIGLLKLGKPLKFNEYQKPIPLANPDDKLEAGQTLKISGFGIEDMVYSASTTHLKSIYQRLTSPDKCNSNEGVFYYDEDDGQFEENGYHPYGQKKFYDNDTPVLCGTGKRGGPCSGDSGGPAVIDGKLVGISILAPNNCDADNFRDTTVYTSIKAYFDWILEHTEDEARLIEEFSYKKKIGENKLEEHH